MSMSQDPDVLVLQGGGCRCFFTLGFLEVAAPRLSQVREIAAVSASSAMACAHALSAHRLALLRFAQLVRRNPRNFYPRRLLRGVRPTPHLDMYRRALTDILGAQTDLFPRLRAGPRVRILIGTGPGPSRALAVGLAVLSVLRSRPPRWLRTHVVDLASLGRPEQIVDTVLASSAFPPFTPVPLRPDGGTLIDGGAVEPIPFSALSRTPRRPLVVLTRPHPVRPLPRDATIVAPDHSLGVSTWEYADEPALRRAYEHGLQVGARYLRAEARGGGSPCP